MAVQLGPNHKDYGKPIEPVPEPRRRGRRPTIARAAEGCERFTPGKLLRAYGREHDARVGGPCPCGLCERLAVLVSEARGGR